MELAFKRFVHQLQDKRVDLDRITHYLRERIEEDDACNKVTRGIKSEEDYFDRKLTVETVRYFVTLLDELKLQVHGKIRKTHQP